MFYDNEKLVALLPANDSNSGLESHGGLTFGGFVTDDSMKQHRMIDLVSLLREYMCKIICTV